MARSNAGQRIDANFTEDVVGLALESFLSVLSFPQLRFSIEPFTRSRERWLGADARLHSKLRGFRPFYMQFKRPAAYPDSSRAKVIRDRKQLALSVHPTSLFFGLREKQPSHFDYQHNILYRLRKRLQARNIGDAAYVCPLFLDRSAYRIQLHRAGLMRWPQFWRPDPWELEDLLVHDGARSIAFDRIPVLAEHISIPPHDVVTSAKHYYSFDDRGADLCFHSPTRLPDGSSSLARFLADTVAAFFRDDGKIRRDGANEMLQLLIAAQDDEELLPDAQDLLRSDDPIANWQAFGARLRRDYEIEQFALVAWEAG